MDGRGRRSVGGLAMGRCTRQRGKDKREFGRWKVAVGRACVDGATKETKTDGRGFWFEWMASTGWTDRQVSLVVVADPSQSCIPSGGCLLIGSPGLCQD